MAISPERICRAIDWLAAINGVSFDIKSLAEDVACLARTFPENDDFEAAVVSTVRALDLIVSGRVDTSKLSDDYERWECCHYQRRVMQGERATMRIMFAREDGHVRVRGFGDRNQPDDFYRRMANVERTKANEQTETP